MLGDVWSLRLFFKRWSKLLERIARVSEAVNSGEDIELEPSDKDQDQDPGHQDQHDLEQEVAEDERQNTNSVKDINILSSRLDKTEQSLDSLGTDQ